MASEASHKRITHLLGSGFALRFASLRFASLRFASLHFASLRFASLRFDSLRFDSIRFDSLRFTSIRSSPFISLTYIHLHHLVPPREARSLNDSKSLLPHLWRVLLSHFPNYPNRPVLIPDPGHAEPGNKRSKARGDVCNFVGRMVELGILRVCEFCRHVRY